jgi:hypothetical protein
MTFIGISLRKVNSAIDDELLDMGPRQRAVFLRALDEDLARRSNERLTPAGEQGIQPQREK